MSSAAYSAFLTFVSFLDFPWKTAAHAANPPSSEPTAPTAVQTKSMSTPGDGRSAPDATLEVAVGVTDAVVLGAAVGGRETVMVECGTDTAACLPPVGHVIPAHNKKKIAIPAHRKTE